MSAAFASGVRAGFAKQNKTPIGAADQAEEHNSTEDLTLAYNTGLTAAKNHTANVAEGRARAVATEISRADGLHSPTTPPFYNTPHGSTDGRLPTGPLSPNYQGSGQPQGPFRQFPPLPHHAGMPGQPWPPHSTGQVNAYGQTLDEVATAKRREKSLSTKVLEVHYKLTTSDPLKTAICLHDIANLGETTGGKTNINLLLDTAAGLASRSSITMINKLRQEYSPTIELWNIVQLKILEQEHSRNYLYEIHTSIKDMDMTQRSGDSINDYVDKYKHTLTAINHVYTLAAASRRETDTMTNDFLPQWTAGLKAQHGIQDIMTQIVLKANTEQSLSWDQISKMAKAAEEVSKRRPHQNSKHQGMNNKQLKQISDNAQEDRRKTATALKNAQELLRKTTAMAETTYQKTRETSMRQQQALSNAEHDSKTASDKAAASNKWQQKKHLEKVESVLRQAKDMERNSKTNSQHYKNNSHHSNYNSHQSNAKNRPRTSRSRSPKRKTQSSSTHHKGRKHSRSRSPDRHAAPQNAMQPGKPMSAELRERVLTGRCFRCDKSGHNARDCTAFCPDCGQQAPNRHDRGCKLLIRSRLGNGSGR